MNEVEDFESFLDEGFNEFKFANDLLLGTNDHECEVLDIETSIKKLTFDLDEVEKRMKKLSSNHYEDLITNFQHIESTNSLMKSKITPNLERVNNSFSKVNQEIIQPYEESVKMNQALKKIHTTLDLLRGSNFFFMIMSQIEDLEKSGNNIIKLCRMYRQVNNLLQEANEELLSIQVIREFQPIHNVKYKTLVDTLTTVINNEINHSVKFDISNTNLKNHLIGYYILENNISSIIERTSMSKKVQVNSSQLSRSLQSPRNFNQLINEVNVDCKEYLKKLSSILKQCEIFEHSSNLLDIFSKETGDLSTVFWKSLVKNFEKTLVSTMARGGPVAKNLKIYQQGISKSIQDVFEGEERDMFLEAIKIIK